MISFQSHTLVQPAITKQETPTTQGILGYTAVSSDKKEAVNENKKLEEIVLRRFEAIISDTNIDADKRCLKIAITNLQDAFMWANRGIFKPERINEI